MPIGVQYRNETGTYTSYPPQQGPPQSSRYVIVQPERTEERMLVSEDNYDRDGRRRDDGAGQTRRFIIMVDDEGDQDEPVSLFETKEDRQQFVQKVYGILSIMLLVNSLCVAIPIFNPDAKLFVQENMVFYIIAYIIFIVVYIPLVCYDSCRRNFPLNLVSLVALTLSMGYLLATICAFHSIEIILYATVGTFLITVLVTLIATFAPCDITGYGMYLCLASVVLMVGGLIIFLLCTFGYCGTSGRLLHMLLAMAFVLLFSMYMMYHTQMIMGGRRIQLAPDEYIAGALFLWADILNIFLCLLSVFRLLGSN